MNGYCPLCQKYLLRVGHILSCPTRVHFSSGYQRSHFEQAHNADTSTWCIPPYLVINNLQKNISQVMITKSFEDDKKRSRPVWSHLFETELINPGDAERLKKRIKALVIFS